MDEHVYMVVTKFVLSLCPSALLFDLPQVQTWKLTRQGSSSLVDDPSLNLRCRQTPRDKITGKKPRFTDILSSLYLGEIIGARRPEKPLRR